MRRATVAAALVFGLSAGVASAQDWRYVAANDRGDRWYIDAARIVRAEGRVWVYALIDYATMQTEETHRYHSAVSREAYDCRARTEAHFDQWHFSEPGGRGAVVFKGTYRGNGQTVPADSIGESMLAAACAERSEVASMAPTQRATLGPYAMLLSMHP